MAVRTFRCRRQAAALLPSSPPRHSGRRPPTSVGGFNLTKEPIDIEEVRFVVYEEDERREGRPAVEARWSKPTGQSANALGGKVEDILSRLGPDEWSFYRPPGISHLDITPVFEISLSKFAKAEENPYLWHRGLSLLRDRLEGAGE